jgi:hypothetical protein
MPRREKVSDVDERRVLVAYFDEGLAGSAIAARVGLHPSTVYAILKRNGVSPDRKGGGKAAQRRAGAAAAPRSSAGPADLAGHLARLERLTSQSIAALEVALGEGRAADPERGARALATHVRTLASLAKLQAGLEGEPTRDDEPPARSLSELRDDLRRHLERIQDEED